MEEFIPSGGFATDPGQCVADPERVTDLPPTEAAPCELPASISPLAAQKGPEFAAGGTSDCREIAGDSAGTGRDPARLVLGAPATWNDPSISPPSADGRSVSVGRKPEYPDHVPVSAASLHRSAPAAPPGSEHFNARGRLLEASRQMDRDQGTEARRWHELGIAALALRAHCPHGTWTMEVTRLVGESALSRVEKGMRLARDLDGAPQEVIGACLAGGIREAMLRAKTWRNPLKGGARAGTTPPKMEDAFVTLLSALQGRQVVTRVIGGTWRIVWADTPGPALWEVRRPSLLTEPGFVDALGAVRLGEREGRTVALVPAQALCPFFRLDEEVVLVTLARSQDDKEFADLPRVVPEAGRLRRFVAGRTWRTAIPGEGGEA